MVGYFLKETDHLPLNNYTTNKNLKNKKMKNLTFTLVGLFVLSISGFAQADKFDLKSQNLHKKVAKTIEHYYYYHERSGGFIKNAVTINNYNDDGLLTEKYYQYNSTYSGETTTKETLYHYNSKNQLLRTEDISAKRGNYSSSDKYSYNSKGQVTKKQLVYKNGDVYDNNYKYDTKGRLSRIDSHNSKGKLTSRDTYSYNGDKKTIIRKNYDTKTGNVSGTYTSTYKDDKIDRYVTKTKYGNSTSRYTYDKKGNQIATTYKDNTSSNINSSYVYDKRGNWIKKHYKSGKTNNYFYFREVIFKNGNTTGSVDFDKKFINKKGNFSNVSVVPIVKYKARKKTTSVTQNIPKFTSKDWIFNYVNLNKKLSSMSGEVTLRVQNANQMSKNTTVKIGYSFAGKNYSDTYTVSSYTRLDKYHLWALTSNTSKNTLSFSLYFEKEYVESRDLYLAGILAFTNGKTKGTLSFYLE